MNYNFTILQNQKRMNLITMRCICKWDRQVLLSFALTVRLQHRALIIEVK